MPHESYLLDVLLTGSHASGQAPHSFDLVLIRQRHASDRSPADLNGATFSPHALKPSVSPLCGPKPDTTSFPRSGRRHTGGDVVPEVRIICIHTIPPPHTAVMSVFITLGILIPP